MFFKKVLIIFVIFLSLVIGFSAQIFATPNNTTIEIYQDLTKSLAGNHPNSLLIEKSGVSILNNDLKLINLFDLEESNTDVFITLVSGSNKLFLYKNGKKINSISLDSINLSSLINNLQNSFSNGEITNLQISGFALSSKRVWKSYLDFSENNTDKHLKEKIVADSNLKLYYSGSNIDSMANFADPTDMISTWTDLSGNKNNATLTNFALAPSPTTSSGQVVTSGWDGNNTYSNPSRLTFDGVNDYVEPVNSSPVDFTATTPFTFEFWINAAVQPEGILAYIISKHNPRDSVGFNINITNFGGRHDLFITLTGSGVFKQILALPFSSFPINEWKHVVVSYDGSSKGSGVKIYYNGVFQNTFVSDDELSSSTKFDLGKLRIGTTESGRRSFKGSLGDVRIYNKALSSTEVLQNYQSEQSKYFQAPKIVTLSPANSSTTNVQTDLAITFDQLISKGTGNIRIIKANTKTTVETIAVTSDSVTISDKTATINPVNNLIADTTYYIEIDQDTFKYNGVSFPGISDTITWNFLTERDSTQPKITALNPENGSQTVPVASDLVVTFDKTVYPGSGGINIFDTNNPRPVFIETIGVQSPLVTGAGTNMITINPSTNFASDTLYLVTFDSLAFQDGAGTNYKTIDPWIFLTVDTTPISVTSFSPSDDATNVLTNTNLQINFNKPVMVNAGNITIKKSSDNSIVETISVTSNLVTGSGTTTITTNPNTDLTEATEYYVNVDANTFNDTSGNNFTGITDKFTWSFKTADITPPVIKTLSPLDGSTKVNANSDLIVVFSEPVLAKTGNINIYKVTTTVDPPIETIDVTSNGVKGSGTDTITINPTKDLEEDVKYYINIDATAFTDLAGNAFSGISTRGTWNFQIIDVTAPTITNLSPTDNAGDVMVDSNLGIIFNEVVSIGTGNININKSADNTIVEMIDVTGGLVTGFGTNSITINPVTNFTEGTSYFITIAQGAFADFYGNTFSGISNKSVWNFTTIAPEVIPVENQGGIMAGNDDGQGGGTLPPLENLSSSSSSGGSSSSSSSGGSSSSSSSSGSFSSSSSSSSSGFFFPVFEEDPSSLLISPLTITGPEIIKPSKKKIALTISHPEIENEIKCSVIPIGLVKILTEPKEFSFTPGTDTVDVKLKINKKAFKQIKQDSSKRNVQIKVLCDDGEKSLNIELAPK